MGSEYFINSQELENKVRTLLPSQGGAGAGFDLSASTQIIPIIDLTESAEGSNLRQDLQTSLSHDSITSFSVNNTTTNVITNTGYFRIFGNYSMFTPASGTITGNIQITDGSTVKIIKNIIISGTSGDGRNFYNNFDFIIKMDAGDTCQISSSSSIMTISGCTRQIASIDGTLTNP